MEGTYIFRAKGITLSAILFMLINTSAAAQRPLNSIQNGFLEPNKFCVSYDQEPNRLLLSAGIAIPMYSSEVSRIGAECLIWSGLQANGEFQFPVETADYLFGIYMINKSIISHEDYSIRMRLSHISSHLVDGARDTIIGGSSSRFSREFVSAEVFYQSPNMGLRFNYAAGVKYIFHQVQNIEPLLQFPITIESVVADWHSHDINNASISSDLRIALSTAASSQYPSYSVSAIYRYYLTNNSMSDIYVQYRTGASNYGIDGTKKRTGYEIGVRLSTFSL